MRYAVSYGEGVDKGQLIVIVAGQRSVFFSPFDNVCRTLSNSKSSARASVSY